MENNATELYDFTIIVPMFNEKGNLHALEKRLSAYLEACPKHACVMFVDDGSTDGGTRKLEEMCGRHHNFFFREFAENRGLSAALKAGIDATYSEYVGYMDADLQTAPEDFDLLLAHIDDYTLVTGVRKDRKDGPFKRLQSRIGNSIRQHYTHDGATDTCCPLKVMHTSAARKLPMFNGMHRFIPALVLLQEGGSFLEVPVQHFRRKAGKSKFHFWNRMRGPLADCRAYKWMRKRFINYNVTKEKVM